MLYAGNDFWLSDQNRNIFGKAGSGVCGRKLARVQPDILCGRHSGKGNSKFVSYGIKPVDNIDYNGDVRFNCHDFFVGLYNEKHEIAHGRQN